MGTIPEDDMEYGWGRYADKPEWHFVYAPPPQDESCWYPTKAKPICEGPELQAERGDELDFTAHPKVSSNRCEICEAKRISAWCEWLGISQSDEDDIDEGEDK